MWDIPHDGVRFLFHRGQPAHARSWVPSTSVFRLRVTRGDVLEVERCIEIAVDHQTARVAPEDPLRNIKMLLHPPTPRALLRRRVETVRQDDSAPIPGGLVLHLTSEFTEGRILERP